MTTSPQATGLVALAERIELWSIDRLRPYERNPRTHSEAQVDQIAASMVEFGWTNPILIDEGAGILAGHGRLLAARKLGLADVPVIRFEHLSEAQKRAYILADNQIALQAGWSEELLAQELAWLRDERFDLDLIGFDASELALADGEAANDEADDEVPEPPEDPVRRPGDLWILGNHRLLCGDATVLADVERVLGGHLGTPVAKGELYRWLKLEWPTEEALDDGARYPPGACHFPQYGEEYFRQLTAERLVTRIVKGFPRGSWEKEPGRRNEVLDCRVYARAAAAIYGLDRFEERHWRRMEEALSRTVERDDHEPAWSRAPIVRPPARQVIHSGYMAR